MYQENVVLCGASAYERNIILTGFCFSSGDDQTGTAGYVRTVYGRCGRNPDTGI